MLKYKVANRELVILFLLPRLSMLEGFFLGWCMIIGFTGSRHGMFFEQQQYIEKFLVENRIKITKLGMAYVLVRTSSFTC